MSAPKPLVSSPVLGTTAPRSFVLTCELPAGTSNLFLVADATPDGFSHDWAVWCDPVVKTASETLSLLDMPWKSARTDWRNVRKNENSEGGKPILVEGKEQKGISAHAHSVIHFELPSGAVSFSARVAVDDGGALQSNAKSSVRFHVYTENPGSNTNDSLAVSEVPLDLFTVPEGLEVTLWASSPMLFNPTNIDIDSHGRIWVAEGRNYRGSRRAPDGDRIMVLADTNGDGRADSSHVFVEDKELASPLGIAVIDNVIVVSNTPDLIMYTDVNRDLKFDPAVDRREVLLTGFEGRNHDHSLHSVTVGPDGWWYFNCGNMGGHIKDKSGREFFLGSPYQRKDIAGRKSADGHVYIGSAAFRMRPDGTDLQVIGHNFRNSYEQTVTSFGDVFQNDNDDPPACRTTWLMEFGNTGFASADGTRNWNADRRPGQSVPVAQWRQEDPGIIPAGDVYGGGSPTGIVYYENGALGEKWNGLLLSCEAARNVVFGYFPKRVGAGFELQRFDFLTSNPEGKIAGADYQKGKMFEDVRTLFRPSDVAVGPDGAIYVSDWFDPRVGGHQTLDPGTTGAIYRVAPKGFKPRVPALDLASAKGRRAALENPSVHTRALAFHAISQMGESALAEVMDMLKSEDATLRARAVWLLPHLGAKGVAQAEALLAHQDTDLRIVAARALRRSGTDPAAIAEKLVASIDLAVLREAALLLRDVPEARAIPLLAHIAEGRTAGDRWFVEAVGLGASGKENALYQVLAARYPDPLTWPENIAELAWRLHPPASLVSLKRRAMEASLPSPARKQAVDAIAFIPTLAAGQAMLDIALTGPEDTRAQAAWWVNNREMNHWRGHELAAKLKSSTPAPPVAASQPAPAAVTPTVLPPLEDMVRLSGSAQRGRELFHGRGTCATCHVIKGEGRDLGPELTGIGTRFDTRTLLDAMVNPSSGIALGFEAVVLTKKDGSALLGFVQGEGEVVLLKDATGAMHGIPASEVASRQALPVSLMPTASAMGLTAQDLADITAFLRNH